MILWENINNIQKDRESVDISSHTQNPHIVAELMKQYLSMLPEPLLSFEFYDSFIMALTVKMHEDRLEIFKKLISRLPKSYQASSKQILALLHSIAMEAEKTKMNVESLSKIFGSFMLKPPQVIYFRENDQIYIEEIMQILITDHEYLFSALINSKPTSRQPSGPLKMRAPTMPRSPSLRYQSKPRTEGVPHLFHLQQKKFLASKEEENTTSNQWVTRNRSHSNSKPLLRGHLPEHKGSGDAEDQNDESQQYENSPRIEDGFEDVKIETEENEDDFIPEGNINDDEEMGNNSNFDENEIEEEEDDEELRNEQKRNSTVVDVPEELMGLTLMSRKITEEEEEEKEKLSSNNNEDDYNNDMGGNFNSSILMGTLNDDDMTELSEKSSFSNDKDETTSPQRNNNNNNNDDEDYVMIET